MLVNSLPSCRACPHCTLEQHVTSSSRRLDVTLLADRGGIPAYAPGCHNRAEGVWTNLKNWVGDLAAHSVDHLVTMMKNRLKRILYRPELIDGSLLAF